MVNDTYYFQYFRTFGSRLQQQLENAMYKLKGQMDKYTVDVRLEKNYNTLSCEYYYVVSVKRETPHEDFRLTDNTFFCHTLETDDPLRQDKSLEGIIEDFKIQCKYLAEKQLLLEIFLDDYGISMEDDLQGIRILAQEEDGEIKYKLIKTPKYYAVKEIKKDATKYWEKCSSDSKDYLEFLFDNDWMTMDELKTTIGLTRVE